MRYRSTRSRDTFVSAREAILKGLAPDGGLFMPEIFPALGETLRSHPLISLPELAETIATPYLEGELSTGQISSLCRDAFNFPVPLVEIERDTYVLELFHGPTLAFKDFGARFM